MFCLVNYLKNKHVSVPKFKREYTLVIILGREICVVLYSSYKSQENRNKILFSEIALRFVHFLSQEGGRCGIGGLPAHTIVVLQLIHLPQG